MRSELYKGMMCYKDSEWREKGMKELSSMDDRILCFPLIFRNNTFFIFFFSLFHLFCIL